MNQTKQNVLTISAKLQYLDNVRQLDPYPHSDCDMPTDIR